MISAKSPILDKTDRLQVYSILNGKEEEEEEGGGGIPDIFKDSRFYLPFPVFTYVRFTERNCSSTQNIIIIYKFKEKN